MNIPDHFVRLIELPAAVRGVTVPNDDGTFSIYINSLYGDDVRRRTLEHELEHLARDHFYSPGSIAVQEAEANGVSLPQTETKKEPLIRRYKSLSHLEAYLRQIGAL